MTRQALALALPALLLASPAWSVTTGFSLTHEEKLATFPPLRAFTLGYPAAVGNLQVFADKVAYLDDDPAGVKANCDLTSTTALIVDTQTRVAQVHMAFPMTAQGRLIVFDKLELGAEKTNVDGLKAGVYSGVTHRPEVSFEFRADGYVYVFGQKVDTGGGAFLRYDNVFASDCNKGIDNHITLIMFHNMIGGTVLVELHTHGAGARTYKLGPFPMSAEVKSEGIAGIYAFAPAESGRYTIDGMVCNADAPLVLPTGSEHETGKRTRW